MMCRRPKILENLLALPQGKWNLFRIDTPDVWLTEIDGSTISAAAVSSQKGKERS